MTRNGGESSSLAAAARRKTLFERHAARRSCAKQCLFPAGASGALGIEIAKDRVIFHIVDNGACWLQVNGVAPVHLSEEDFVVVTKCQRHSLRDEMSTPRLTSSTSSSSMPPERTVRSR